MRERTRKLLNELEDYRWVILAQLADEAEENADTAAAGWRWLAENRKYPIFNIDNATYYWHFYNDAKLPSTSEEDYNVLPIPLRNYLGFREGPKLKMLFVHTAECIAEWLHDGKNHPPTNDNTPPPPDDEDEDRWDDPPPKTARHTPVPGAPAHRVPVRQPTDKKLKTGDLK